jgi:hypothetical protein
MTQHARLRQAKCFNRQRVLIQNENPKPKLPHRIFWEIAMGNWLSTHRAEKIGALLHGPPKISNLSRTCERLGVSDSVTMKIILRQGRLQSSCD